MPERTEIAYLGVQSQVADFHGFMHTFPSKSYLGIPDISFKDNLREHHGAVPVAKSA